MEDRSLDDFVQDTNESTDQAVESTPSVSPEEDSTDQPSDPPTDVAVEPATVTSRWSPEDEECKACGQSVARLWNDDVIFVCLSCKDW